MLAKDSVRGERLRIPPIFAAKLDGNPRRCFGQREEPQHPHTCAWLLLKEREKRSYGERRNKTTEEVDLSRKDAFSRWTLNHIEGRSLYGGLVSTGASGAELFSSPGETQHCVTQPQSTHILLSNPGVFHDIYFRLENRIPGDTHYCSPVIR